MNPDEERIRITETLRPTVLQLQYLVDCIYNERDSYLCTLLRLWEHQYAQICDRERVEAITRQIEHDNKAINSDPE